MTQFKNRWALITGASSGIGKAFAERLAKEGANLVLVARDQQALESLASALKLQHNIETLIISKDLTHLEAPLELYHAVEAAGVKVDILINNAGMGVFGKLHETELERNQQLLMLNVVALSSLTQLFLPAMLANKSGIVINIASTAAFQPLPYMSNYGASKVFVLNFTEALWAEYVKEGIQFLSVCPGPTDTHFFIAMKRKPMNFGKLDQAEAVVEQALKALQQRKILTICGPLHNFITAQISRFFTRKFIAKETLKVMRSRH